MHVDLLRKKARVFPALPSADSVTSLRVWHCKYGSLEPIRAFAGLQKLVIATYPDNSFENLSQLLALEELEIIHFPRVTTLEPLARLPRLRVLKLASLPSWDSSSKRLKVDSLEPLAHLPKLEVLHLLGVVPPSRSLAELEASTTLKAVRLLGYSAKERERFLQVTRVKQAPSEA
ncbi:MAG: hypothetical protein O9256_00985 [Rhizobiaceae bacterium]|jgi:hypothetical protein|uniref:hypothetical protein n=1 Tax=Gemmatimonas sp. TaxID=1962908 RepID=UPI0022C703A0|nr:hypothetical protein [Rhizobiaceae bacterium]